MKNLKLSKKNRYIIFALFLLLFCGLNIVYAGTTTKLNFCAYAGVRRTLMIIGIIIIIAKIVIPLIIIITGMISFFKTVISGKDDDFKSSIGILAKKIVAGLIIFFLPTVINYAFEALVGYDDSGYTACSTCLLDVDRCVIPDEDPETYTETSDS